MCHPGWAPPCDSSASHCCNYRDVPPHPAERVQTAPICRTITSTRRSYLALQTHCPHLHTGFELLSPPLQKGAVLLGLSYPAPLGLPAVCERREEKDVGVFVLYLPHPGWQWLGMALGTLFLGRRVAFQWPAPGHPVAIWLPLHHVSASVGLASPNLS